MTGQRTATPTEAAAGWYVDPGQADQVRWYDGRAWTTHVRPAPPTLSEPTLSEPALSEPALSEPALSEPALSEPALSEPAEPTPSVARAARRPRATRARSARRAPRFSRPRLLIGVAVVLAGLLALNGVLHIVADSRVEEIQAPSRQLALAATGPESVAGLTSPSTATPAASALRTRSLARLRPVWRYVPGSAPVSVRTYRAPGGTRDDGRGGEAVLVWTSTPTPFSTDAVARRFSDATLAKTAGTATTRATVDGGVVVCTEPLRTGTPPATMCAWVRSATGVLVLAQDGATADELRGDLADAVELMAR